MDRLTGIVSSTCIWFCNGVILAPSQREGARSSWRFCPVREETSIGLSMEVGPVVKSVAGAVSGTQGRLVHADRPHFFQFCDESGQLGSIESARHLQKEMDGVAIILTRHHGHLLDDHVGRMEHAQELSEG